MGAPDSRHDAASDSLPALALLHPPGRLLGCRVLCLPLRECCPDARAPSAQRRIGGAVTRARAARYGGGIPEQHQIQRHERHQRGRPRGPADSAQHTAGGGGAAPPVRHERAAAARAHRRHTHGLLARHHLVPSGALQARPVHAGWTSTLSAPRSRGRGRPRSTPCGWTAGATVARASTTTRPFARSLRQ